MAATLLLAAGEAGVALWQSRGAADFLRGDFKEPPLPQHTESAAGSLLAAVPEAPAVAGPLPASSGAAPVDSAARHWELSPEAAAIISYLWLAGAALVLTRWFLALAARKRLLLAAEKIEAASWQAVLHAIPGGCGVKLLRHSENIVPCAWGRTILLPADADHWPPAQRRMVLAHECAHLHRRDPFWLAVAQCFLALQWFNPIAWYAVRRCRMASERVADDAVLAAAPDAPAYAELLVACAHGRLGPQPTLWGMASPSTVTQRVERILDESADRRPAGRFMPAAFAVAACGIIAAVLAQTPQVSVAREAPPPVPAETKPAETAPAAPAEAAPAKPAEEAPEESNSPGGFQWKLTTIGEREYVTVESVQRFYQFPRKVQTGDCLELRSAKLVVRFNKDSPDLHINSVKFILHHPVLEHDGVLWVSRADLSWMLHPIIKPSHIENALVPDTVVLDPGHGGVDSGAVGARGTEKFYNLETALQLKKQLEAKGWTVVMTRTEDKFVSRPNRVVIANQHPNAIFVSIHFNAHTAEREGMETNLLKPITASGEELPEEEADALRSHSIALATAVHANCLHKLRMTDGGIRGAPLTVLAGLKIPGVLLEGGYISNAGEEARIATDNYRFRYAEAIAQGLENYRRALGQKPNMRDPARQSPK